MTTPPTSRGSGADRSRSGWVADDRLPGVPSLDLELRRGALVLGHDPRPPADPVPSDALGQDLERLFPEFDRWWTFPTRGDAVAAAVAAGRAGGRREVVRFRGCRHGHADEPDPQAPPPGRPPVVRFGRDARADDGGMRRLRFNDAATLEAHLRTWGRDVASLLVEPLPVRMGLAIPAPDFLPRLRAAATQAGLWLVADEGATGPRFGRGGVSRRLGIVPDVTILGESASGGLPFGALGLRRGLDVDGLAEEAIARTSRRADAPTCAAVRRILREGDDPEIVRRLDSLGARLAAGLERIASDAEEALKVDRFGSCVALRLPGGRSSDPASPGRYDWARTRDLAQRLAARAVRASAHPMDPLFTCAAHSSAEIDAALRTFRDVLEEMDRGPER